MTFVQKIAMKNKKNLEKRNRILISIKVAGSAGLIRFIVNEDDIVSDVVGSALKIYAREGRLPLLGTDPNDCLLFSHADGSELLDPLKTIGSCGARNFMLFKKPQMKTSADNKPIQVGGKRTSRAWKSRINKLFKLVRPPAL